MTATTTDPARTFIDPDDPYQPADEPDKIRLEDLAAVILTAACAVRLEGGELTGKDMQLAISEGLKLSGLLMQGLEEQDDEAARVETIEVEKDRLLDLFDLTIEVLTEIHGHTVGENTVNARLARLVEGWQDELSSLKKEMLGE